MEIAIADRDRTPVWSIPGTNIYLTYDEPGPLVIDSSRLTDQHKNIIQLAVDRQLIVAKGIEEIRVSPETKPIARSYAIIEHDVYTVQPTIVTSSGTPQELIRQLDSQRREEVGKILKKNLAVAKSLIAKMAIPELRIAMEIETSRKSPRKNVILCIDGMIKKLNKEVYETVTKAQSEIPTKEKPLSPQLTEIVESDFEEVSVSLDAEE